ncbi:MAG: hypothetical protein M1820_008490 [Bogoriella megaspora]|nr:MAG: hypothetical protein M1820_008490 [Bogoriella megaspora]
MKEAQKVHYFDLPAEIRLDILSYLFETPMDGFTNREDGDIIIDDKYSAASNLAPLLTCRQFYHEGNQLAISHTSFVIKDTYTDIPHQLSLLQPTQLSSIRSIAFLGGDQQFRKLHSWGAHPFGIPNLRLNTLTVVFPRSSYFHYPSDYTTDIVKLLRNLQNVSRLVFVRNGANVKGYFKTWYNRLTGLIMKEDHHRRYNCCPPIPESVWWVWSYDDRGQSFCLEARQPKPVVGEKVYMELMKPLVEGLARRMEVEEWEPDPRARVAYY